MARTKQTPAQQNNSGSVQTLANAGDAGGTLYYVDLGGIKMCWGTTASIAVSGASPGASGTKNITLPAGFFSTLQSVTLTTGPATNTQYILPTNISQSTATLQVQIVQFNGSNGAAVINFLVIGT